MFSFLINKLKAAEAESDNCQVQSTSSLDHSLSSPSNKLLYPIRPLFLMRTITSSLIYFVDDLFVCKTKYKKQIFEVIEAPTMRVWF